EGAELIYRFARNDESLPLPDARGSTQGFSGSEDPVRPVRAPPFLDQYHDAVGKPRHGYRDADGLVPCLPQNRGERVLALVGSREGVIRRQPGQAIRTGEMDGPGVIGGRIAMGVESGEGDSEGFWRVDDGRSAQVDLVGRRRVDDAGGG